MNFPTNASSNERRLWQTASTVMTPRQWEATILVLGQNMTYAEAGRAMCIDERAAARLVNRGLRRVRQYEGVEPTGPQPSQAVQVHGPMAA